MTATCVLSRNVGAVALIPSRTVTPEFSTDGAAVPAEVASNLRLIMALLSERRDHIPFFRGELAVSHH